MSISVTDKKLFLRKTACVYLFASAFTALTGFVYELFSNGVYSYFMIFAFAFPLLSGALPYFVSSLVSSNISVPAVRNTHHSAVALLTLYSLLRGVFEIAGVTSKKTVWYLYGAAAFALFSLAAFITTEISKRILKKQGAGK